MGITRLQIGFLFITTSTASATASSSYKFYTSQLFGRKKAGRTKGDCADDGLPGGSSLEKTTAPFSLSDAHVASATDTSTITSLIGRSDKVEVLRTIESLPSICLDGVTVAAAWDRLAQRTVPAGPRAPHLPPLHNDRAFHMLLERTRALLPDLSPGHCGAVVGNLAKLRYRPDDSFLSALLFSCRSRAEAQTFGQAAHLISGLARLDYDFKEDELGRLACLMEERLLTMEKDTLHPESLSMGLWALAVLGPLGDPSREKLRHWLVEAAIDRLASAHAEATAAGFGQGPVLSEGKAKNLVRICRLLRTALLFLSDPEVGQSGKKASGTSGGWEGKEVGKGRRAAKTPSLASVSRPAPALSPCYPLAVSNDDLNLSAFAKLRLCVDQVWLDLGAWVDPVRSSRLQMEVESTLRYGGAYCTGEWEGEMVTVDVALHPRPMSGREDAEGAREDRRGGRRVRPVALEVDGPSHFFVNQPQRPTGDTKIKHQALHLGGQWSAVISLAHFEWPKSSKQQLAVLKKKIAQTGLEPKDFFR